MNYKCLFNDMEKYTASRTTCGTPKLKTGILERFVIHMLGTTYTKRTENEQNIADWQFEVDLYVNIFLLIWLNTSPRRLRN